MLDLERMHKITHELFALSDEICCETIGTAHKDLWAMGHIIRGMSLEIRENIYIREDGGTVPNPTAFVNGRIREALARFECVD